jgi:hypothetical protein
LTDAYPYLTPYQYAGCEPIANTDLDGAEPENATQNTYINSRGHEFVTRKDYGFSYFDKELGETYYLKSDNAPLGLYKMDGSGAAEKLSARVSNSPESAIISSINTPEVQAQIAFYQQQAEQFKNGGDIRGLSEWKHEIAVEGGVDIMNKAMNDANFYDHSALYSGQFFAATWPVPDPELTAAKFQVFVSEMAFQGVFRYMGANFQLPAFLGRFGNVFKRGLRLQSSVVKVMGKNYKSVGEVTVSIKNTQLLTKLNATSKGNWVKVYEAGVQNGSKIETHYFRNNNTGQVFDVKVKYNYWKQKSFKNLVP